MLWAGRISCSVCLTADLKKPLTEDTVVVQQSGKEDVQGTRILVWLSFTLLWKKKKTLPFHLSLPAGHSRINLSEYIRRQQIRKHVLCFCYSQLIVWIDTDLPNQTKFSSTTLLQGQTFTLRSVVSFKGSLTKDSLGHYTDRCRRGPCVWELCDDLANGVRAATEKKKMVSVNEQFCIQSCTEVVSVCG
ncbi:hypothetical protein XENOCAPTIV_024779 [Xenoophorus captivus]|uniref:Uncharacterized protein n=1 Tax=Xenoophorus captivus TaxID=1517983 RepID=A0ABV0S8Q3_9TELE